MNKKINNNSILFPTSEIESIDFYINGDRDIVEKYPRLINRIGLYQGDAPVNGGPVSLTLGTTDYSYPCDTCKLKKKKCPGHNGHLNLRIPLF